MNGRFCNLILSGIAKGFLVFDTVCKCWVDVKAFDTAGSFGYRIELLIKAQNLIASLIGVSGGLNQLC
jgi:hypothetical protein